jgi:hypothetical protein
VPPLDNSVLVALILNDLFTDRAKAFRPVEKPALTSVNTTRHPACG